jgi:hypothetical protein
MKSIGVFKIMFLITISSAYSAELFTRKLDKFSLFETHTQLTKHVSAMIDLKTEIIKEDMDLLTRILTVSEPAQLDLISTEFRDLKLLEPFKLNLVETIEQFTTLEIPFKNYNQTMTDTVELSKTIAKCEMTTMFRELTILIEETNALAAFKTTEIRVIYESQGSILQEFLEIPLVSTVKFQQSELNVLDQVILDVNEWEDVLVLIETENSVEIIVGYVYNIRILQ